MKQTLKEVTARNSLMAGNEINLMETRGGDAERVRMKGRLKSYTPPPIHTHIYDVIRVGV